MAKKKVVTWWSFLTIVLAFLSLSFVLLFSYESSSLQNRHHHIPASPRLRTDASNYVNHSIDRLGTYGGDYSSKPNEPEYESIDKALDFIKSSTILKSSSIDFKKYLLALEGSVRIVNLPPFLSSDTIHKCDSLRPSKPSLLNHQHSLEIRFPSILKDMAASAASKKTTSHNKRMLNPLWHDNDENNSDKKPLFYYLESYVYHAIYCTNKKNYKEDWTQRDPYWLEVSKYITETVQWKENNGIDFLISSSHPQSGPTKIHPASLSYLLRASFLRTDFDASGSNPKDIIVPYLSDQLPSGDKFKDEILLSKKEAYYFIFLEGITLYTGSEKL